MLETIENLNSQAIDLAAKGMYKEAIACFKRAILIENTNYLLWFNLGVTYRDNGDLEQSKLALQKALTFNPFDPEILDNTAIVCNMLGQSDDATAYILEALDLDPDNANVLNTYGVILFNQGNYEQASEAFERAVTINPYYYDALFNLRDTYDELGNEVGKLECEQKMKSIPNNQGPYNA